MVRPYGSGGFCRHPAAVALDGLNHRLRISGVNTDRLQGKVIVIVGGTSGLGLSAAQACVGAGAAVVVVGRDPAKCATAVSRLGARSRAVTGDACDPETVAGAIRNALTEFSGFDGLYHVAHDPKTSVPERPAAVVAS